MKYITLILTTILLGCSMLISCDNTDNNQESLAIFNQDTDILKKPAAGPVDFPVEEPSGDADNDDISSIPAPQSNIRDGQSGVEVNTPITMTFAGDIDENTVIPATFYLKDDENNTQYARIEKNNNSFSLIPQIRLQPGHQYTITMCGVKDTAGKSVEDIVITFTNDDLDFGLYFFGKYGLCEKYFPGVHNTFYDPSKQTVIFSHGWQQNSVTQTDAYGRQGYNHEIFYWAEDNFKGSDPSGRHDPGVYNGQKQFTNHAWIDKGWNTAITYWTQFAGGDLLSAESRIWNFNGPGGSKYHVLNDKGEAEFRTWNMKLHFNGEEVIVNSVAELLGLYVIDALQQNTSGNIRLVGHSLGNQVANNLAHQCFKNNITVNRIALLDPAWTAGGKSYLGDSGYDDDNLADWTGERCRYFLFEMMDAWNDNLAVEIYHTTGINLGIPLADDNAPLTNVVCDVNNSPWYYVALQLKEKHVSIRHSYFWSMSSEAPEECTIIWPIRKLTGEMGPSAATPSWRIIEMMNDKYEWTQVEGRYTPDPADDWFERKKKESGLFGSII